MLAATWRATVISYMDAAAEALTGEQSEALRRQAVVQA
jgi:hypothetical protein